jgi:ParB family chromosome partitioning protein
MPTATSNGKAKKTRTRRKKAAPSSRGLSAQDVASAPAEAKALGDAIISDGGSVLAAYKDPLGGHGVVFASLPIDLVEPTPFQRDVSDSHVKRLMNAMDRVGRFLDPLIAVRQDSKYWTPNGSHRLTALKQLGAKSVVALVLPEEDVAYQILALNTEKAHNIKERSLEVIRMYRGLAADRVGNEEDFAALFEEPAFITLGASYEKRPRFSAGAYQSIVKRVEKFLNKSLVEGLKVREARADKLLQFDDAVIRIVDSLKQKGFVSPYLKYFVVSRLNFLRFKKGDAEFDPTLDKLIQSATKFDSEKVRKEDINRMGGPAEAVEEA